MMKYAKLENGAPVSAPTPIRVGEDLVGNPPAGLLRTLGFKPVTETPLPAQEAPAGYRWAEDWTETDDAVVQSWQMAAVPPDEELDPEEALALLLGGAPA